MDEAGASTSAALSMLSMAAANASMRRSRSAALAARIASPCSVRLRAMASRAASLTARGALARLALTGNLPDGDYKVWAPYPADLLPHSQAVGGRLYAHMGIARRDRQARDAAARRNCEAFGAPVIGFVLIHKDFMPFAALDAGLMLQTLFLSAKARGVDSCPLGVLATWRRPFDAEFEAPADYGLITGFALGYASDAPVNDFRAERRPVRLVPTRS